MPGDHWRLSTSPHHPHGPDSGSASFVTETAREAPSSLRAKLCRRDTATGGREAGTFLAGRGGSSPAGSPGTSLFSADAANVRNAGSGPGEADGLTPGFSRGLGDVMPGNHSPSVSKFPCFKQYLFPTTRSEKRRQQAGAFCKPDSRVWPELEHQWPRRAGPGGFR